MNHWLCVAVATRVPRPRFAAALYHGLTEMAEPTLRIPFDNRFLEPKFGWAFHMTLALGVIVNVLGVVVAAASLRIEGGIVW